MDVNISRDDYFASTQPRHIPGNDHPPSNKTQTPKYLSSEREIEWMKRLNELEGVIEELKGQVTAETAPSHHMPQKPGHQDVRQPQVGNVPDKGPEHMVESGTTSGEQPLQLTVKRRRLSYSKCTFCRKDKDPMSINSLIRQSRV